MTIPKIPFAGRMSYCLVTSLQMVLESKGREYSLPWLECVSGEPFGFTYVRDGESFFAVDGYAYHLAGEHLLRTLNYTYTYTGAPNSELALAALDSALCDGPVVAGMLDMGYLTYAPNHRDALGSDHAIVVLARQEDRVIVHDPAGYACMPLPLTDFLEAWQRDIYTGKPYGMWRIGVQGEPPTEEVIWERVLARARENFAQTSEQIGANITLLFGPNAMLTLADDLRTAPEKSLGGLPYFSWRVSAQRCIDSAAFIRARLPAAAAIRWEQGLLYGELQLVSATGKRSALPGLLEQMAELEARFVAAINEA